MNLNELAKRCHKANAKWWQNIDTGEPLNRNPKELLMLMVSELSEAMEGERKDLMDDKLPHRKMAEVEIVDFLIRIFDFSAGFNINLDYGTLPYDGGLNHFAANVHSLRADNWPSKPNKAALLFDIVVELSRYQHETEMSWRVLRRSIILACDYAAAHGYDLDGAFNEKMAFNATRQDHTHEARRIAGGKQF